MVILGVIGVFLVLLAAAISGPGPSESTTETDHGQALSGFDFAVRIGLEPLRRLVAAMAGEPLIEAAPASELVFRVFAGPTVILTGKSPILNVKEQKNYDFRWVCVYVTAASGWQLAVSQATRLAPPA